tara:strand:+ start:494 stop:652 length:159 start_codon:yes stop_codon:yes gene_type:complete
MPNLIISNDESAELPPAPPSLVAHNLQDVFDTFVCGEKISWAKTELLLDWKP